MTDPMFSLLFPADTTAGVRVELIEAGIDPDSYRLTARADGVLIEHCDSDAIEEARLALWGETAAGLPGNLGQCANLLSSFFALSAGAFHAVAFETITPGRVRFYVRAPDGSPLELTLTDPNAKDEAFRYNEAWQFALFMPAERVAKMVRLLESNDVEVFGAWPVLPGSWPVLPGSETPQS
ncbi:hypothetical protein AB0C10_15910 [Microbispora amethystogenes]|uniref:hypothetical protein n=1 Tax=Microbispora amethystogenes TaxID=1427754 RepID=UPI003400F610